MEPLNSASPAQRELLERLDEALNAGSSSDVSKVLQALIEDAAELAFGQVPEFVLGRLRARRRFDDMIPFGRAILAITRPPEVARHTAQALIETGRVTEAVAMLHEFASRGDTGPEQLEIWGLLGRAYKQLYLDAKPNRVEPRRYDLDAALGWYRRGLGPGGVAYPYWHEINVVALLYHGARFAAGSEADTMQREAGELATKILDAGSGPSEDHWAEATLMEACIAVNGRDAEARSHLDRFLGNPKTDAFAVRSALRQIREVWGLSLADSLGQKLIPPLEEALVGLPGGSVELFAEGYEKVFGSDLYDPFAVYMRGAEVARAVGRIGRSELRKGDGTGFLVTRQHVLTCWHVVRNDFDAANMGILFTALGHSQPHTWRRFKRLVWTGDIGLDASLLELEAPVEGDVSPIALGGERVSGITESARVYVIGHPQGGDLCVSLHNSELIALNDRFLQYRTPTDPGSSGSPVFDRDWNLVGLHHKGDEKLPHAQTKVPIEANQAVRIDLVTSAIKKQHKDWPRTD